MDAAEKLAPSLEAVGITKKFGEFAAVSDLNLKIQGTRCVGFLGPNGAGKTTTMKIFTGLLSATEGSALINGVDVSKDKKAALASCTSLIETPEIYPALTPKEALTMLCEIRGVPASERSKRIDEALGLVKMQEWESKKVGSFSKGMKQRVNVASTLLSDPEVVILDEPSTGLDPRGMSEVRGIIKSLKGKSRLIFMSSHILGEVSEVCDEVAMVDHGKLVVYDTIANVTARFSGGENIVEVGFKQSVDADLISRVSKIAGVTAVERGDDTNIRVRFTGGLVAQESILASMVGMNLGVISYKPAASALEDAYLGLIKDTV